MSVTDSGLLLITLFMKEITEYHMVLLICLITVLIKCLILRVLNLAILLFLDKIAKISCHN